MKTDIHPIVRALMSDFPGSSNDELHQMIVAGHPEFRELSQTWVRCQICGLRSQLRRRKRIDLPNSTSSPSNALTNQP